MARQLYLDFLEKFEGLSPYELGHLTRVMHKKYKMAEKRKSLNKKQLQNILVDTMKDIQIECAEQQIEDAKLNLQLVKLRIYNKQLS